MASKRPVNNLNNLERDQGVSEIGRRGGGVICVTRDLAEKLDTVETRQSGRAGVIDQTWRRGKATLI